MYTAIFSRTYPMRNIGEVLDAIAADGFEGVQANLSSAGLASLPDVLPPDIAGQMKDAAASRGVRIAALSGTYNMAHPDPQVRQASRAGFANVVIAAQQMGAPIVTLCTGSRDLLDMWKPNPDNASAGAWHDLRFELEFALGLAEAAGIHLAIEPEPANVIRDARTASRLLKDAGSAYLGIILDAANLLTPATLSAQQAIMLEAADLLGGALLLAHAKDIDASGNVVAPGEGEVDLLAFASALRSVRYDGAFIAHGFTTDKTPVAFQTLQRIIGESA